MTTKLQSRQIKASIDRLMKKCSTFYEQNPGAWLDPERAKRLTELEQELHESLRDSRGLIDMRRVEMRFYKEFQSLCNGATS